jgi:hypothetical protein
MELLDGEWFTQIVDHAGRKAQLSINWHRLRSNSYDGSVDVEPRFRLADRNSALQSVYANKPDIHYYQIELDLLEHSQRLLA